MKVDELRAIIAGCCNDVLFVYNGVQSGITSEVKNYVPVFRAWYGEKTKEYSNIDILMSDSFFGGKSLAGLVGIVEFLLV